MKRATNTTTIDRSKLRLARTHVRVLTERDLEQAPGGCSDNCPAHTCGIAYTRNCSW